MNGYYGRALLEDWLAEEVFYVKWVPKSVVVLFEPYRVAIEQNIEGWMDSDGGDGNRISWRGWGRGFDAISDENYPTFKLLVEQGKTLLTQPIIQCIETPFFDYALVKETPLGFVLVYVIDHRGVGSCKVIHLGKTLYDFKVKPKYRQRGYGQAMMGHLVSSPFCPKRIISKPYGETTIPETTLINFYRRFGYEVTSKHTCGETYLKSKTCFKKIEAL